MKTPSALKWLVPPIFFLALAAASLGLFYQTPGQSYPYTNHRGETVMINGHGLYFFDTVSSAAQMQGNDLITLVVGLPLLAISFWMAWRGSLRGRLLLTGTLGFFLYTYMSMSMLTSFNALFLVYVTLFSLSVFAFSVSLASFDLKMLPSYFSARLPRGWFAGVFFAVGLFFFVAWVGRVVAPFIQHTQPALENTTTMVIQAMDLGLLMPLAVLSGILLLRRSAWGYLLASVFTLKGLTMGLAVSTMAINMALAGVPDSLAIIVPFLLLTLANLVVVVVLLKNIRSQPEATLQA
jgi:hypothetical protein